MNWKSTAAVSGATLLATWLGWSPAPQPAATPAARSESQPVGTNDIQTQAERLQQRVRTELEYRDPTRNPFRFGARPAPTAPTRRPDAADVAAAMAAPLIQPLPFILSGMATQNVDGAAQRTAILTMANDVLFVKEGDRVGTFTVTHVDETGVDVTGTDGSIRRLVLTP